MRRKKQPTADMLRQQLALAADEIIRLKTALAQYEGMTLAAWRTPAPSWRKPWWRRLLGVFS